MLDIGWSEMAVVVVIALLVVGPKDLPKVLRAVRYWIGKARAMAREFQDGVDELVREAELKELKAEVEDATRDQLSGEFDDLVDPTGNLIGQPDDDVRAPGRKADAGEPAGKPADGHAPAAERTDKETVRTKQDGGDGKGAKPAPSPKPASNSDGPGAPDGAESGPATPAEPQPVERGTASASGR